MKISRIKMQNFRSVVEAGVEPTSFNIFVGQNNHGKTNIFEAVEWVYGGLKRGQNVEDLIFGKDPKRDMFVEIEFVGAIDGANRMRNESNRTKMQKLLGENDVIRVRRSSGDPKNRVLFINGEKVEKLPTGFDTAFNDFLPRFEYVDTKKYFEDVGKYAKGSPIAIMLSAVLTAILEESEDYQAFQKKFDELFGSEESEVRIELDKLSDSVKIHLAKQFPDCTKVYFEIAPPIFDDLLKSFETTVNDGIETRVEEKGDGMQRALMLSILQVYAQFRKSNEEIGKSFLFFIDEAELHLHPTAQRKLKNVLVELSGDGDQVFINTHSSVFVANDGEGQTIFAVEKLNKETSILPVGEKQKADVVFDLLGGTPADLLLPRNFFIVEGKSEVTFLAEVIARHYPEKPQIQLVPACGDLDQSERSINAIKQTFTPLEHSLYGDKLIILIDKPRNANAIKDFLNNYRSINKNDQLKVLPTPSIEEYYPDVDDCRRTSAEVAAMSGHKKIQLARKAGRSITKESFENDMNVIFLALETCWGRAF